MERRVTGKRSFHRYLSIANNVIFFFSNTFVFVDALYLSKRPQKHAFDTMLFSV